MTTWPCAARLADACAVPTPCTPSSASHYLSCAASRQLAARPGSTGRVYRPHAFRASTVVRQKRPSPRLLLQPMPHPPRHHHPTHLSCCGWPLKFTGLRGVLVVSGGACAIRNSRSAQQGLSIRPWLRCASVPTRVERRIGAPRWRLAVGGGPLPSDYAAVSLIPL